MRNNCPKCEHPRDDEGAECPNCGVIYDKAMASEIIAIKLETRKGERRAQRQPVYRRLERDHVKLIGLAAVTLAIVALLRWDWETNVEPLLPGGRLANPDRTQEIYDKYRSQALALCVPMIEQRAKWSHRWTDGWGEPRFDRYQILEDNRIVYIGNHIEFQNGFGAWSRHTYRCTYDPRTQSVTNFTMSAR